MKTTNRAIQKAAPIIATLIVAHSIEVFAAERMDVNEGKGTTRNASTPDGETRPVLVNPELGRPWQDIISIPERVMALGNAPKPLDDDNEAPPGATQVCCYAVVVSSGEVFAVDPSAGTMTMYDSVSDYEELYYFESHYVMEITDQGGMYDETDIVVFDADIEASYTSNSAECDLSTMAGAFTSLPSVCGSPSMYADSTIWFTYQGGGTYRGGQRALTSACLDDILAVSPYEVSIRFEPMLTEVTCAWTAGAYDAYAAATLRPRLAGEFTRTGIGSAIPWSGLFADDATEDFVHDPMYAPPQVAADAEAHWHNQSVADSDASQSDTQFGQDLDQVVTGTFDIPTQGKSMQAWLFYNGPARDQATLCVRTDIYGGLFSDATGTYGLWLNREPRDPNSQNGIPLEVSFIESGRYGVRCDIAYKGFHDLSKGYLVPTIGSVFAWQAGSAANTLDVRLPNNIDESFDEVFWEATGFSVGQAFPEDIRPSYVLTNLAVK